MAIPDEPSRDIKALSQLVTYGWGVIPVTVQLGQTTWRTSLFPSKQVGGWLLPLKAAVRKAEKIVEGSVVEAQLALA